METGPQQRPCVQDMPVGLCVAGAVGCFFSSKNPRNNGLWYKNLGKNRLSRDIDLIVGLGPGSP